MKIVLCRYTFDTLLDGRNDIWKAYRKVLPIFLLVQSSCRRGHHRFFVFNRLLEGIILILVERLFFNDQPRILTIDIIVELREEEKRGVHSWFDFYFWQRYALLQLFLSLCVKWRDFNWFRFGFLTGRKRALSLQELLFSVEQLCCIECLLAMLLHHNGMRRNSRQPKPFHLGHQVSLPPTLLFSPVLELSLHHKTCADICHFLLRTIPQVFHYFIETLVSRKSSGFAVRFNCRIQLAHHWVLIFVHQCQSVTPVIGCVLTKPCRCDHRRLVPTISLHAHPLVLLLHLYLEICLVYVDLWLVPID